MNDSVLIDFVTQAREKRESIDDPVTEDAAALAFTERYRDTLRFDHDIGKWFVWTDTQWQCERTGLDFSWARELARELA
jgi:putative DNA primase/helicase